MPAGSTSPCRHHFRFVEVNPPGFPGGPGCQEPVCCSPPRAFGAALARSCGLATVRGPCPVRAPWRCSPTRVAGVDGASPFLSGWCQRLLHSGPRHRCTPVRAGTDPPSFRRAGCSGLLTRAAAGFRAPRWPALLSPVARGSFPRLPAAPAAPSLSGCPHWLPVSARCPDARRPRARRPATARGSRALSSVPTPGPCQRSAFMASACRSAAPESSKKEAESSASDAVRAPAYQTTCTAAGSAAAGACPESPRLAARLFGRLYASLPEGNPASRIRRPARRVRASRRPRR